MKLKRRVGGALLHAVKVRGNTQLNLERQHHQLGEEQSGRHVTQAVSREHRIDDM